ncbi:MAG TPA: type VI secretion system tip protein TssI/VgrG [Thermoanaerobaculia bacterium]|nr:type VI secretion system tip protein TssI/VgrG [Thermoanaerobaculia bacterium]
MAFVQANHYLSISTPLGKDKLLLRRLRGEERVSGLFHFFLDMQSEDPALDFSKIVGKSATVTVELADGSKRYVNGIVGRFVQAGGDARFINYHAELRPWLWLTTMSADCRIWQNKSVVDIVTGLFKELGFTDFRNATSGTYDPLEYCVQYNETHFAFVSRLLEDAGISYFFEHADGKHTLVLADASSAYKACPGAAKVTVGTDSVWQQQNVVTSCVLEENVISGAYAVDDYSFETPATDLTGTSKSTKATNGSGRRVYEYPGGFTKKNPADATAKRRMEELEVPNKVLRGASYCRAFFAGAKTTLEKHYRSDANTAYLLLAVEHEATEQGYANSFEAVPADVPLRPQRRTPRPRIAGTQTAAVVGKSGEEIWTDKYGRVKVQFHWDQKGKSDENSSCWIRVAQGWAGKSWGAMFLPRIGQEVVVTFLDGDPDRPLITGAVYNATNTVPYALPSEQTKSTVKSNSSKDGGGGFNELRFEDKKDSEEIFVQAQKDLNVTVKNDETVTVGAKKESGKGNQTISVYNNRAITVEEGKQSLEVKKGDREVTVTKGNETHSVAGTRAVKVTKAETHTSSDNYTHDVSKNYTLKVTGNLVIDVTGNVTIKSGANLTVQALNIANKATTALNNEAMNVTNKASVNLTNQGAMVTSKADGLHSVEASGILTVKGALVKIN